MDEIYLDVSELAPPDPMSKILMALAELQAGQYLRVAHSREPVPLYEKLQPAGWGYSCQVNSPDAANQGAENPNTAIRYFIYIYRLAEQDRLLDYLLATDKARL
ncbi:DUF2249 domain-containing protein [Thalassomonas actiniarum]|uniref:DUF2249 domain-containing protein n=1 Tax=Thalassomonas actiniarum TaxID=485447 RepID=A0AAE9YTT7_9GAMM|nr:DUF2249 domain-containing protein [Thalassomonas actiniarum]WDE01105.1 DUF2249 domain-containing protein [Thalassomonas actiniarum]